MAWVAAGIAAVNLGSSLMGSSAAKDAAKENKRAEKRHTTAQLSALARDQERDLSLVEAIQAGSGFSQKSVSRREYMQDFKQIQFDETEWLKSVGASRFAQRSAQEQAIKFQGYGQAAESALQLGSSIYDIFKGK